AHPAAQRLGVPDELGNITQALKELLSAPYLSDEERAALRVEHGVWTQEDLANPQYAARAALAVGAFDHPSLNNPDARPFDRAAAALKRGQPQLAINILDERTGLNPPSYILIRAQALEMLGRPDDAIKDVTRLGSMLTMDIVAQADELASAVEGLMDLTRLQGPQGDAKQEYQSLAKLLANARDNIDRLNWRVRLVEAKLLYA